MTSSRVLCIVIGIAVITVVGDYFIKLASLESRQLMNRWFGAGCAMYLLSTVGWVFVMPHMKLAVIGVVYSLSVVILMALLGVCVFGESITRYEVAGLFLGASAILLLGKFGS
jgi:drug/metabolite transporter (DMT)-like permease